MAPLPDRDAQDGRPPVDGSPGSARALALGFAGLATATYGLVVLGALVRANGAGLACPDWPLCFGEVVPAMDLKVAFEWGHRAVAGGVGLVFAGLAVAVLRRQELRRPLAGWIVASATLLVVQVVLGALTVWELLASWTVTSHLVTGNAFMLSLALVAWQLWERGTGERGRPPAPSLLRFTVGLSALLLAAQMVLGGLVSSRFIGLACSEWPTCSEGVWFPTFSGPVGLHLLHRLNGYALAAAIVTGALASRAHPRLSRLLTLASGLVLLQIAVGVANVLWRIPVEVTGLHSALAAALVLVTGSAVREAWLSPGRARNATTTPAIDPGSAPAR